MTAAPRKTEAERWKEQAETALARFAKSMQFFLFSVSQLVKLTEIHAPDDYTHCTACREPWPCRTITIVKTIGSSFDQLRKDTE